MLNPILFSRTLTSFVYSASHFILSSPGPELTRAMASDLCPKTSAMKCRNFLANLLELTCQETQNLETTVRLLIQNLIDAQIEPENFCNSLEKLLNATPQPCLIAFLKRTLPFLRQSLFTKELVIDGINAPSLHTMSSSLPIQAPGAIVITNNSLPLQNLSPESVNAIAIPPQDNPVNININTPISRKALPLHSTIVINKASPSIISFPVVTAGDSLVLEKNKMEKRQLPSKQIDNKVTPEDDINDVTVMVGVDMREEIQSFLSSTASIGTQIRSCEDEYLIPKALVQTRLRNKVAKNEINEPAPDVAAIISHAVQERLKNLIEKLVIIGYHRLNLHLKRDNRYEVIKDVRSQLKFLEQIDSIKQKKCEDSEREILLKAAKSRAKHHDPEQALLIARAKEKYRIELDNIKRSEADRTALLAIGPPKKARLFESSDSVDVSQSSGNHEAKNTEDTQFSVKTYIKRIQLRDMIYLLEQEKNAYSTILFRAYLK